MRGLVPVVLMVMGTNAAPAQSTRLGSECDLAVLGETETKSFLTFDQELRSALSRNDAILAALLVRYPLRVNDSRGSWYIHDSSSFQKRFQEIFPPPVRTVVLKSRPDSLHCSYRGVMYGNGTVWINDVAVEEPAGRQVSLGFAVVAVNLLSKSGGPPKDYAGDVEFAGRTSMHRVIVDRGMDGRSRLRLWLGGQSLLAKPAWEIPEGTKTVDGTGPCAHTIWTFAKGISKFFVSELGCYGGSDLPSGATGQLVIEGVNGSNGVSWLF